jgi:hypothetical protein
LGRGNLVVKAQARSNASVARFARGEGGKLNDDMMTHYETTQLSPWIYISWPRHWTVLICHWLIYTLVFLQTRAAVHAEKLQEQS